MGCCGTVIRQFSNHKKLIMEIEIFTLADFAQDNAGRLTIVGTFDRISSKTFPATHPSCSLASRLRFAAKEAGEHSFTLKLIDSNGKDVIAPIEGNINVALPPQQPYAAMNLVVSLNQLKFEKTGRYSFELYMDGEWKTGLPLILNQA
jgi:hypothetical protein